MALANREQVIREIRELGLSDDEAREMVATYETHGGSGCVLRWPTWFSLFAPHRNVADILFGVPK